jgi:hypothetical protein
MYPYELELYLIMLTDQLEKEKAEEEARNR